MERPTCWAGSASAGLPWYRGVAGAPMQAEAQALCEVVEQANAHGFALSIDCHSGFGLTDRIWFPHAHTPKPVAHLPELHALGELLDRSLLHHRYVFEPQSLQYLSHGLTCGSPLPAGGPPGQGNLAAADTGNGLVAVGEESRQVSLTMTSSNPLIEHSVSARHPTPPWAAGLPAARHLQPRPLASR